MWKLLSGVSVLALSWALPLSAQTIEWNSYSSTSLGDYDTYFSYDIAAGTLDRRTYDLTAAPTTNVRVTDFSETPQTRSRTWTYTSRYYTTDPNNVGTITSTSRYSTYLDQGKEIYFQWDSGNWSVRRCLPHGPNANYQNTFSSTTEYSNNPDWNISNTRVVQSTWASGVDNNAGQCNEFTDQWENGYLGKGVTLKAGEAWSIKYSYAPMVRDRSQHGNIIDRSHGYWQVIPVPHKLARTSNLSDELQIRPNLRNDWDSYSTGTAPDGSTPITHINSQCTYYNFCTNENARKFDRIAEERSIQLGVDMYLDEPETARVWNYSQNANKVTGAAALVWSKYQNLSAAQVKDVLVYTATGTNKELDLPAAMSPIGRLR